MKSIVIIGAGGFGREVLEIFKEQNKISREWDIRGFVDEDSGLYHKTINGFSVLGGLDWLREYNDDSLGCVCAIGDCRMRKQMVEKLHAIGVNFYNAIHPSVIMSEFIELGHGVIICAGSVLTVNIEIGDHVHIDTNCTVAHDAAIKSYCRLNPGVNINGANRLGEGVYVGTGATIIQDISVGSWSKIGAGAVVTDDIPEHVVAVGIPAKVTKK